MKKWMANKTAFVFGLWLVWMATLFVVSSVLHAAAPSVSHLPIAYGAPFAAASTCNGAAPIHDVDTGDLDAILTFDGRFIVAYQDRAHGSLVHVAEHVGAALVEVKGPPTALLAGTVPQFSPSGPKQGSVALVAMAGGKNRLYYTQRKVGDETGPYGIWCLEW